MEDDLPPDAPELPSPVSNPRPGFRVFGGLRTHPDATELATEAHRSVVRYAAEVVAAFRLCPFLKGVDSGLGAVGVVLEVEPSVDTALAAMKSLGEPIVHLVYPVFQGSSSAFERFGSKLAEAVRRALPEPLVHASFHPEMVGGRENAYRLIGLLRQSPDPFVQFIPHGLQQGGTVLAGEDVPEKSHAEDRFARLMANDAAVAVEILERLDALKRERSARYAELVRRVAANER
ncbi:MAG: hypothetical protein IPM79_32765 [Polyangiaceae bacterium]|jgi:hypothetical protein|nr:hypothetical protein [Polyangiaceae bacterium]MBK8942250.1 hypothetical protein [Polyangiaceae bacterium]